MLDIADKEVLLEYALQKKLIQKAEDARIHYFSGGVSGTVAMITEGNHCFIIKQALNSLKVAADWQCDQSRMQIEYEAQKTYWGIIPNAVSKPISFDEDNYIMVRDAAPEDCVMWKTDLMNGMLDFQVAQKAIDALSSIHNQTAGDSRVQDKFSDDQFFYGLRISPYIEYTVEKYPELKSKAGNIINMLSNERIALTHGDYSPKNIMVDKEKNIYILDLEVAFYGHPAFDLAFFANHFLLKSVKNRQWSDAYLNMLTYMMNIYFDQVQYMNKDVLEYETIQVLGMLFLARVDGKSPVEYLTEEKDKNLVRRMALMILEKELKRFDEVIDLVKDQLRTEE